MRASSELPLPFRLQDQPPVIVEAWPPGRVGSGMEFLYLAALRK